LGGILTTVVVPAVAAVATQAIGGILNPTARGPGGEGGGPVTEEDQFDEEDDSE